MVWYKTLFIDLKLLYQRQFQLQYKNPLVSYLCPESLVSSRFRTSVQTPQQTRFCWPPLPECNRAVIRPSGQICVDWS